VASAGQVIPPDADRRYPPLTTRPMPGEARPPMTSPTVPSIAEPASPTLVKRRVLSTVVDGLLLGVLLLVLRRVIGPGFMAPAVTAIIAAAVFGVVQGETGVSPGKALTGLRLVNETGRPPGTGKALVRLAAWAVDGLPCGGLLGLGLIWFTPTHQRLGDTVTRCFVVGADGPGVPEDLAGHGGRIDPRSADAEHRRRFDPIWDSTVGAYVQWDPAGKRWMRYDDQYDEWTPVDPF